MAADRPETQFAGKEVCRWMASPTELGLAGLKRLGRFIAGHKRLVYRYPQLEAARIDMYSDTN